MFIHTRIVSTARILHPKIGLPERTYPSEVMALKCPKSICAITFLKAFSGRWAEKKGRKAIRIR